MNDSIMTALITAGATLIICLVNNFFQMKKTREENRGTIKVIEYKLEDLSDRVNKHNNLIERTYELEKRESIVEEKIKVINNRIHDLEEDQT